MKILVIDIAASTRGALSVLLDFYEHVKQSGQKHQWVFVLSDRYLEETENIKVELLPQVKKNWFNKLVFDFCRGKRWVEEQTPDLVISFQNTVINGLKIPQYVYMHQSIPFQSIVNFSFFKKEERTLAVYQHLIGRVIKNSMKKADRIIVQTQWIKKAIIDCCGRTDRDFFVIPPRLNLDVSTVHRVPFDNKKFIYPTFDGIYKNIRCIEQAAAMLRDENAPDFSVDVTISSDKYPHLNCVGFMERDRIMEAYSGSTLIFPSYIETFGLPLLEARCMGTIILSADTAFAREVLEHYENAYFFNAFKPEELSNLMKQILTGKIKIQKKRFGESPNPTMNWNDFIKRLDDL